MKEFAVNFLLNGAVSPSVSRGVATVNRQIASLSQNAQRHGNVTARAWNPVNRSLQGVSSNIQRTIAQINSSRVNSIAVPPVSTSRFSNSLSRIRSDVALAFSSPS